VVLSGHRDTFFRPLRGIRTGDRIAMVTRAGSYQYIVDWTAVVDPSDTATLQATPHRSLTLVTCYPFRYVGPAPRRFIVRARQISPEPINTASD
jgi:sortase A